MVYVEDAAEVGVGKLIAAPNNSEIRFYVAIPVDGVAAAITEWVKSVGDVKLAAGPLRLVIAQKLCRKLCLACRVGYQPSPDQAKNLALPRASKLNCSRAAARCRQK